jgi:penicillin-binding protein 2
MAVKDFYKERQFTIIGVFGIVAFVLLIRAAQLQLVDTSYQSKAEAITIEKNVLYPSRGVMFDRNNQLLVFNNALYDLMVTYKQIDRTMDTLKFCRLLGIDTTTFRANLEKDWKSKKFSKSLPFPFMTMLSPEIYARLQESLYEFPGFYVQVRNVRGFPQHNGAHVLGYISEVKPEQIERYAGIYESGDYIGSTGLERQYEPILRGKKGFQYILKDNVGRLVGAYKNGTLDSAAVAGKDLILGLDIKMQALAERCLENKIGAIIAIEPSTGEILTMCSSPTYDPEKMTINKARNEMFRQLYKDSLRPLFDRAAAAEYAPGSIFKPMVALIGLQSGVWDTHNGVSCSGGYHYNSVTIKCHAHSYAGDLKDGIAHSCNAYFITILRALVDKYGFRNAAVGLDSLDEALYRFGMGHTLGIDYPGEKDGNVPTSKFYNKLYPKARGSWYSTNIMSIGIGQGEEQLTTLQMANLAATIANRGWYYTPHLVKATKDGGKPDAKFSVKHFSGVDAKHFAEVIEGMEAVIQEGTGSNARVPGIDICGKTGTSQNPHGNDSSVFIGFAPKNNPKIAVAVYIENGGFGNDFAAPITGLMIEQYLNGSVAANRQYLIEKVQKAKLMYSDGKGYYVQKAQ